MNSKTISLFATSGYIATQKHTMHHMRQGFRRNLRSLHRIVVASFILTMDRVYKHILERNSIGREQFIPSRLKFVSHRRISSLLLTDRNSMMALNLRHKDKNAPTDCLCFPAMFPAMDASPYAVVRNCRSLHNSLMGSDELEESPKNNGSAWDPSAKEVDCDELDLGIVALCPAFMIDQCTRSIGTSRASLGIPVRNNTLRQACETRARCASIHAALHMLGYTHRENSCSDMDYEDALMSRMEKRIFTNLFRDTTNEISK